MVAGLQHDASVSKLKLLELQRAVSFPPIQSLNIYLCSPQFLYFRMAIFKRFSKVLCHERLLETEKIGSAISFSESPLWYINFVVLFWGKSKRCIIYWYPLCPVIDYQEIGGTYVIVRILKVRVHNFNCEDKCVDHQRLYSANR